MKFTKMHNIPGKIYSPDKTGEKKKDCKDCFFCSWCCDSRCNECLKKKNIKQ